MARELDPWLLADGLTRKVVVEADWVDNCEPGPKTLEGLRRILLKYGPPGLEVEIVRDDEISLDAWKRGEGNDEQRVRRLIEQYAELTNEPGIETRYVLFAPRSQDGYFGYSYREVFARPDHPKDVSGVVVFRESHAHYAKLWISLDKLERMTLVHEFGHQLGLVSDPRHERVDAPHRSHCTRLDCSMAHPTPRVIVRNFIPGLFGRFFRDYCKECQAELRTAQAVWREQQRGDPNWSLKQAESRAARAQITLLWDRYHAGDYEAVLAGVEAQRTHVEDQTALRWLQFLSLAGLGRVDEIVRLRQRDGRAFVADQFLGRVLIGAGRHTQLLELLPNGEQVDSDSLLARYMAHHGLGDPKAAAHDFERYLALVERNPDWHAELANLFLQAGELPAAERTLEPLLRRDPSAYVLLVAARLRQAQGRLDESKGLREKSLRASEHEKQAVPETRARALLDLGRAREALDVLDRSGRQTQPTLLLALAALDHLEELGQRIRELSLLDRGWIDPCALDELVSRRADPRLGGALDYCPPRREKTEATQ